jgi:phosphate transport system ATP-binding protein
MVSGPAGPGSATAPGTPPPKIRFSGLYVYYGNLPALRDIELEIRPHEIFGIIGPAGSGKTTLLRTLNRTVELVAGARVLGKVEVDGRDILGVRDVAALGRRIGMVAPLPVGLPMSIFDNVAFAPRMAGLRNRRKLAEIVERCLRQAALWDEVKDRLDDLGTRLSGGQQQRLTIARALSHAPEILCLDEFSIAIDPVTTMRIEEVLRELKSRMTILLVTNLVQQARRLADRTAFLLGGELVEVGPTERVFSRRPRDRRTYLYTHGMFG